MQTTIVTLHRAGGRGGAPHPPATEGPHRGMGGVRTDGAAEGQDPRLCIKITDVCMSAVPTCCASWQRGMPHLRLFHRRLPDFTSSARTITRSIGVVLILFIVAASYAEAPTEKPVKTSAPASSLRSLAQARGIQIGAAVAAGPVREEPLYAQTLRREFSMLTPENAMKFGPLHPDPDRYNFADADAIIAFAKANAMQVRAHTLVWHEELPRWLTERTVTREDLMANLRQHILTVVGRYRGRVVAWDVVNEAMADSGSLRDTIWLRGIGPDYIDLAFRWAHEADPKARLFYNDYGGEGLGRKSDAIYALVRSLQTRGVPIHGVGLQTHIRLESFPALRDVAANMNRLAALKLEVHITEMDVRIKGPVTEEALAAQARIYRDTLGVCLSVKNCKAFVLWGFTDRHSWIPQFFPGWGTALIFDESYRPKPAYTALMDALKGR